MTDERLANDAPAPAGGQPAADSPPPPGGPDDSGRDHVPPVPPPGEGRGSLDAIRDIPLPPLPQRVAGEGVRAADADEWDDAVDRVGEGRALRSERQARVRSRRRARTAALAGIGGAFLLAAALVGLLIVAREPVTTKLFASADGAWTGRSAASGERPKPIVSTPVFAHVGKLTVYLPVKAASLTGILMHPTAYGHSYHMVPGCPPANGPKIAAMVKAGKKLPIASAKCDVVGIVERDGTRVIDSTWVGNVVKIWRSGRPGKPDTAADVGAKAGTVVVAPVTGKVSYIRRYKLYGRINDYEIHIKPDRMPSTDLVMLHVQNLTIAAGDRLVGGVTPVAHVRNLHTQVNHQLAEYTGEFGDHTHIQFNWPRPAGVSASDEW